MDAAADVVTAIAQQITERRDSARPDGGQRAAAQHVTAQQEA